MANFNRRYILRAQNGEQKFEIQSGDEHQLRVAFRVTHWAGGRVIRAQISIYNLSRASEQLLKERFTTVVLVAGYELFQDIIFSGQIINAVSGREDADTLVTLYCNASNKDTPNADINKTLPDNSSIIELFQACADAYNAPLLIDETQFQGDPLLGKGVSLQGDPKVILNNYAPTYVYDWFFENVRLVVTKRNVCRLGETISVSMINGLVGSPSVTERGCNIVVKMNPRFRYGTCFTIDTIDPQINFSNVFLNKIPQTIGQGTYRADDVIFRGDTHGEAWDTLVKGFRIDG